MIKHILLALLTCVCFSAIADSGAVPVRISDPGGGHCIGPNETVTITLRRIIVEKESRYLGIVKDSSLGLALTTTVIGSSDGEQKSASFTKITNEPLETLNVGQVSLAREKNLLNQFSLTNDKNVFNALEIDIGMVKTSGTSDAAKILLGAVGGTSNLNLPANPFTSAYGVATAYVRNLVQPLIDQAASQKEATSYTIAMNIGPGSCVGDSEMTGTKAIISSANDLKAAGAVDISHMDDYCFNAILKPAFVLKASKKDASGNCTQYTDVANSYIAFYVNAWDPKNLNPNKSSIAAANVFPQNIGRTMQLTSAMRSMGISEDTSKLFSGALTSTKPHAEIAKLFNIRTSAVESVREAIARCDAHGTDLSKCL